MAEVANTIHYATTNKSARQFISKSDLANPVIYASDEVAVPRQALSDVGAPFQARSIVSRGSKTC